MIPCDRPGNFRASIVDYGLVEEQSGAIAISLSVKLLEYWEKNQEEPGWISWAEYNMSAEGKIYVIKTDKTVNQRQAEALMKFAGWDGSFDSIANNTWIPSPFACTVEPNEYKGVTTYRVGFINDYNRAPGMVSNVSADKAKALQTQYGSSLRALAGTVKRNGSTPSGTPQAPPKPPPVHSTALADPPLKDGDIPFSFIVGMIGTALASSLVLFS